MSEVPARQRLDMALVARGLVVTRARAADIIRRGEVEVDGTVVLRPALRVGPHAHIALAPGAGDYVSRGALKLRGALDRFGFEAAGRVALDVGASTGGFTQVLLEQGATRVYAVDNGRDQLHATLRADPRVVMLEETDARTLTRREVPEPIAALVADASFISLTKVLPAAMALVQPGAWLVALVKPQFEVGRGGVGKDGIVAAAAVHAQVLAEIGRWLAGQAGWRVLGTLESPIKGGDGNTEFLIGACHDG